jgi:SagB-type dehydrogenase family enzyme
VQRLWANCGLALGWPAGDPEFEIEPAVAGEVLKLGVGMPTDRWKVSRFAQLHVDDSGGALIETPRIPVITRILKPRVAAVLVALAVPRTAAEMLAELRWRSTSKELLEMLALLWSAGVITRCDAEGLSEEDAQPELLQWEPHDLAFHMRSRQGRHSYPMGASFRFRGRLDPHPAVKPNPWRERAIALPKFDLAAIAARDPPFTSVLEFRRSIRAMDFSRPISLAQIAEFLFRTARVRHRFNTEIGEFTSRPYPNGGASYEFELYLTINACAGLERGFYYYDPEGHTLSLVRRPDEDTEALLDDAWVSSARQCRPQVLITIASRFHRVSWKYSGMAYAAQLKNAGCALPDLLPGRDGDEPGRLRPRPRRCGAVRAADRDQQFRGGFGRRVHVGHACLKARKNDGDSQHAVGGEQLRAGLAVAGLGSRHFERHDGRPAPAGGAAAGDAARGLLRPPAAQAQLARHRPGAGGQPAGRRSALHPVGWRFLPPDFRHPEAVARPAHGAAPAQPVARHGGLPAVCGRKLLRSRPAPAGGQQADGRCRGAQFQRRGSKSPTGTACRLAASSRP